MKRILVIEDDEAVRGLIVETLKFKGWRPLTAQDGEAGLAIAVQENPDLILCDIQMPRLDGYGVLRQIRANATLATVPFIFLTGLSDKPKMRQAMELGADDYLVKPFTVTELIAAVEARLQKQAALEETAERKLNELRESLTFALPHELVTPLNTILGFSSLLLDSPEVSRESLTEYASHIRDSGQRLRTLIEKFLLYAQLEVSASDPAQRLSNLRRAPSPTAETISTTAIRVARENRRERDLKLDVQETDHRVGPAHLERTVRELVENASRFSEPGTSIEIGSRLHSDFFELTVRNRGVGFNSEQLRRLGANLQFDRRLHEQQGTGLGLAITRRLAELNDGVMEIESTPGETTIVRVRLPC